MMFIIILRLLAVLMVALIFFGIALKLLSWKVPQVRIWLRGQKFNTLDETELEVDEVVSNHQKRHRLAESLRRIDPEQDKIDKETISNIKT